VPQIRGLIVDAVNESQGIVEDRLLPRARALDAFPILGPQGQSFQALREEASRTNGAE